MSEWVTHGFEPVSDDRSRVLILGTMPSPASREKGFYYSHPRNRFWKVMASLFDESEPRTPEEKRAFCLRNRIALWDVLHRCRIDGASDASIREAEVNDIAGLLEKTGIRCVCTTGSTAAALYRKHFSQLDVSHIALPSTSPANARMGVEELIAAYRPIREAAESAGTGQ